MFSLTQIEGMNGLINTVPNKTLTPASEPKAHPSILTTTACTFPFFLKIVLLLSMTLNSKQKEQVHHGRGSRSHMLKEVRMEISTRSTTATGCISLCWLSLRRTTHAQPLGK
jgi:hypothetical protein